MEKFDLSLWLKDKSRKICTRDGRPVRIVCWDSPNKAFPIVGFIDNNPTVFVWDNYGYSKAGHVESKNDLFFAADKLNSIIDELKSYLEKTPKEQVEKDWKEIQDWYTQHFTNEKYNENEELTEFEKEVAEAYEWAKTTEREDFVNEFAPKLFDLARKEIEKEHSEFKPKFTYNEKDYSELANKLIEFRNNTPLCSVSYRDGEGRKIILHYEKEIFDLVKKELLKDLPKWKKATKYKDFEINEACILNDDIYPIIATHVNIGEYYLELDELKNLPLEE